ncbi:MAG: hypothetical protein JO015_21755 [Verrucomicrobia bacterium]|nr:hypothetical protein [Verrucomicrobiota bacterium]
MSFRIVLMAAYNALRVAKFQGFSISTAMEVKLCLPSQVPCQRYTC